MVVTYRCALSEEIAAAGMSASCERGVIDLGDVHASEVDFGAGSDGVGLIDALNWHAVDLVRAGDQQKARRELSEEHDALATESAGEKDKHGSWHDTVSELGGSSLLSAHLSPLIVCGIPLKSFDH